MKKIPYFYLEVGGLTIFQSQNAPDSSIDIRNPSSDQRVASSSTPVMDVYLYNGRTAGSLWLNGRNLNTKFNIASRKNIDLKPFLVMINEYNRSN